MGLCLWTASGILAAVGRMSPQQAALAASANWAEPHRTAAHPPAQPAARYCGRPQPAALIVKASPLPFLLSPSMQQPQIILLKEGTDTSQGKPQLISNINACVAVADVVRTTLGPRGMDKLIHDDRVSWIATLPSSWARAGWLACLCFWCGAAAGNKPRQFGRRELQAYSGKAGRPVPS